MRRAIQLAVVPALATLGTAGVAVPAEAASGSLSITTIDRTGHVVKGWAHVTNIATGSEYTLDTGKSRKLGNGRYGIGLVIDPDGNGWGTGTAPTLASRSVSIKGRHVTVTFDARQGRPFNVIPNAEASAAFSYEANVCVGDSNLHGMVGGLNSYVIPTSDKNIKFSYQASWGPSAAGPYYWASSGQISGIPSHAVYSYAHASFAKILFKVLKGKRAKSPDTELLMSPTAACSTGYSGIGSFSAPRTVTAYVSTGTWSSWINWDSGVTYGPTSRYVAGKTYHVTVDRS